MTKRLLVVVFAVVALGACGKDVNLKASSAPADEGGGGGGGGNTCRQSRQWRFVQPEPLIRRELDVLFVVDSSPSLDRERRRLAAALPAFVGQLQGGTDFRIGVMAAHGGASRSSGRLFSADGVPLVLDSTRQSAAEIEAGLGKTLALSMEDEDEANGEALLYSLSLGLSASRLAESRTAGFFRPTAGLGVVFVTDENDICYPPELHGHAVFPDFVPSVGGIERVAFDRYCSRVNPANTLARLRRVQAGRVLTVAGVVHVDPARVPRRTEDAIGHGILELLGRSQNSLAFDIEEPSYAEGLSKMGAMVSTELRLRTAFELDQATGVLPGSVWVKVDGRPVRAEYHGEQSTVRLRIEDAGTSGSVVTVGACLESESTPDEDVAG